MNNAHAHPNPRPAGIRNSDRGLSWTPRPPEAPELVSARRALATRRFAEAERHLQSALLLRPECAEIRTLLGVLHETIGEHHAAYQCYRLAVRLDPRDTIAAHGLLRYCQRFGHDPRNPAINPAAARPV